MPNELAVITPVEKLMSSLRQGLVKQLKKPAFLFATGLLVGVGATLIIYKISGFDIRPLAKTTVSAVLAVFILLLAVGASISAHSLREPGTISADTYFKIIGVIFILSTVSFLVMTGLERELFFAVISIFTTALGFVFGKTAKDKDNNNE